MDNSTLLQIARYLDMAAFLSSLISTIIGGLIVLWATFYLQKGKVYSYILNKHFYFVLIVEGGNAQTFERFEDTDDPAVKPWVHLDIEFYNSSNHVRIAREIKVKFVVGSKIYYSLAVDFYGAPIPFLNFEEKKVVEYTIKGWFPKSEELEATSKIYLEYRDEKNRVRTIPLHKP